MGKNVGLTYGEFKFPREQGFTGSAGVHQVRGYQRGGRVKKSSTGEPTNRSPDHTKGKGRSKAGFPGTVKAKGGKVGYGEGGYYGKPGDQYPKLKSGPKGRQGKRMPKNVKARGGSVHDKLKSHGKEMGYKYGGYAVAKDTSSEFRAKRGKQDPMDHGVQPARRGRTQQEIEAGGTKRLKPGLKHGGRVHRVRQLDKTRKKGKSRKGFPATVKARGGPATTPGKAKAMGLHKSAARRAPGTTRSAKGGLARYAQGGKAKPAGDKFTHPKGRGRKPYTGYNEQPGGSKIEDARYMKKARGGAVGKGRAAQ